MLNLDFTKIPQNGVMILIDRPKLETSRLFLIPLDYDQLSIYTQLDGSLEFSFGLKSGSRSIDQELEVTIQKFIIPYILQFPEHILYATLWILILKREQVIIGDIGFKGAPSSKGLLEIGYATYPEFRNLGFMTEALGAMSNWAFAQENVEIILAETDKDNLASQLTLKKNKFELFAETDCMYWWRLDKA